MCVCAQLKVENLQQTYQDSKFLASLIQWYIHILLAQCWGDTHSLYSQRRYRIGTLAFNRRAVCASSVRLSPHGAGQLASVPRQQPCLEHTALYTYTGGRHQVYCACCSAQKAINQFYLDQQSRQQALRAYCSNIHTLRKS